MMKTGDHDQLLHTGESGVSNHAQVLGHPYQDSGNAVCQSSSYRSDDHKQQEGAYKSGKERRYQKPYDLRHFPLKENIQLGRDDTDEQGYDNTALETDQLYRKPEYMKGGYIYRPLGRSAGVCQTVCQHDTADNNTHDGSSAEPLHRTVSYTQGQESKDSSRGYIDQS